MKRLSPGTSLVDYCSENSVDSVETKRVKFIEVKSHEEQEQKMSPPSKHSQPNSSEDESSREKALGNPIILQNILKHFSTSFLLSSCSLVNKAWNKDARIFIRNKRKCTARNPDHEPVGTCRLLYDVRNFCGLIREAGREIPFNGFKTELSPPSEVCPKDAGCDGDVHVNLKSEMILKHLDIEYCYYRSEDEFQNPIVNLIRDHASEIQHLTTHSVLYLKFLLDDDESPSFPQLKQIAISGMDSFSETVQKTILRRLREKSPNLRSIFVDDSSFLEVLPEECYGLVGSFSFSTNEVFEDGSPLSQIMDKKPTLRKLSIYESFRDEDEIRQALRNFLTQLLQSCQDSLEDFTLHIKGLHVLPLLPENALLNLSNLSVHTNDKDTIDELWNLLASIDGDKMMPKLEEVELHLTLSCIENIRKWPPSSQEGHFRYRLSSVRRLTLYLLCVTVNMHEVKTVFPNVASLELHLIRMERIPCQELWELWPNLEELKVEGVSDTLRQNYDAEFCGIHEEETQLMREMDGDYLRSVHLVPIRPSLLTMRNLRTISINFMFSNPHDESDSANSLAFMSKLRQLEIYKWKEDDNNETQQAMRIFLTQLLQSCQHNLEGLTLHADGLHILRFLPNHAVKNLSNLSLETRHEDTIDKLWNLLASIDGDKIMPKLEELDMKHKFDSLDGIKEWPSSNRAQHVRFSYSSVRKLTLDLQCVKVNLQEIKTVLPNVTSLDLRLSRTEHVPCTELWELWPNLEEIKLRGAEVTLRRNYDAEFCGINEEEAELLRGMDEECLLNVHIVPIRPSLVTMPNLRTVSIDFKFRQPPGESGSGSSLAFMSKVTELVALQRLSHRDAKISWA